MTLADDDDEQSDEKAGGERDLIQRAAERSVEEVEIVLADREPEVAVGRRLRSDPARDVDEGLEYGGRTALAEADPVAPRGDDLGARAVVLHGREIVGCHLAVAEHGSVGGDERHARARLPGRLADALDGLGPRPEVVLELGRKALKLLDELAAAALVNGSVQNAREGERESAPEDDPEQDRDERAAQDSAHRANL